MFVPSLNLDGTLKKRSALPERLADDGQPGLYSPRIPSSAVQTAKAFPTPSCVGGASGGACVSPIETSASSSTSTREDSSAVGISDPEVDAMLLHRSRMGSSERSLSNARRSGAMATLVDHQQARQGSPSVPRLSTNELLQEGSRRPSVGASTGGDRNSTTSTPSKGARGRKSVPGILSAAKNASSVSTIDFEEAYILGHPFAEYMQLTTSSHRTKNSAAGTRASSSGNAHFRQNPTQYISSMAVSGDYVAVGDRAGRVAVMQREPITLAQQKLLLQRAKREDDGGREGSPGTASVASPAPRSRDHYRFHVSQQAYSSVIDPLNSVEVTPNVSALAFLPQNSAAAYLLTANEKVPKLYKVANVRESAHPFRAVDKIGARNIGPLTASSRKSTVAMKIFSRYALNHEYNINSICPLPDSEQFVSADDLTMQLWCTEYPDNSIETYDLRPSYDEEPREAIRCVRSFPHEPFLLFAVTSPGNIRVIDIRQTLKWVSQTPQIFVNLPHDADGMFGPMTKGLSDCSLSPCGRYIAGRDFMRVPLWDVRMSGGSGSVASSPGIRSNVVRSWELHPHLQQDLETLYQSDLLFERFDLTFMNHTHVCTGGFNNSLFIIDVTQDTESPTTPLDTLQSDNTDKLPTRGVNVFQLPSTEGVSELRKATLPPQRRSALASHAAGKDSPLELGSRIPLMSRPFMSLGGACGMMVSCGQVAMQLSYNGLKS